MIVLTRVCKVHEIFMLTRPWEEGIMEEKMKAMPVIALPGYILLHEPHATLAPMRLPS